MKEGEGSEERRKEREEKKAKEESERSKERVIVESRQPWISISSI